MIPNVTIEVEHKAMKAYYDHVVKMPWYPNWNELPLAERMFWVREVKSKMEYTIK